MEAENLLIEAEQLQEDEYKWSDSKFGSGVEVKSVTQNNTWAKSKWI